MGERDLAAKWSTMPRPKAKGRWSNEAGLNMTRLIPMVREIRTELRKVGNEEHITRNQPRGFYCQQVLVYGEQNSMGWHQDVNTRYGCLNFIFNVGLACKFGIRTGGEHGKESSMALRSGDIIVFEGQTWHTVQQCLPDTSPFGKDGWLHNRRLSVPIRQNKCCPEPTLPKFLENKKTPQKQLKERMKREKMRKAKSLSQKQVMKAIKKRNPSQ